ncbi:unnamed protein product [Peronospora belbahrii]|uniref:Serine-threonine kinase receptor-associated protein n=1 Tax=Peronospora belbahrii TaxID=622444 RepID=A0ABN8CZI2_9STRA|nr:unnamed protein product [Peronospora belbahrii]
MVIQVIGLGHLKVIKELLWSAKLDHEAEFSATGSADFSVKIWDALTGDLVTTFEHKHVVKSVAFTLDGRRLLTAGHEKVIRIFDIFDIKQQFQQLKAQGREPTSSIVPSGPLMEVETVESIRKIVVLNHELAATGEIDGTVTIWNLEKYQKIQQFRVDADVMDMEASRNGTILTIAAGKQVYFYDASNEFALLHSFPMPISFAEEGGASLHPTENKFVAGGSDTWVRVFDSESGELLETHKGHHGPVRCLRYSPSGNSFATGSEDGTIRIWQNDIKSAAATSIADTIGISS